MTRVLALLVAAGCGAPAKPTPPKSPPALAPGEIKFAGTITGGRFDCAADGPCEITIDNTKEVLISGGYLVGPGAGGPQGQAWDLDAFMGGTRTDFVGTDVEVFAIDHGGYTLAGSTDYYVRMKHPPWPVPDGWKREQIMFPLEFAKSLSHRGIEDLRFPPGFLDATSPNRWSYAFAWHLTDEANLDAAALGAELTTYFRGLLGEVDGDRHRFAPASITVHAEARAGAFDLGAHLVDAFNGAAPIDLVGTARRAECPDHRVVWRFVLAPRSSPIRAALDELAARAPCG